MDIYVPEREVDMVIRVSFLPEFVRIGRVIVGSRRRRDWVGLLGLLFACAVP